MKDSSGKVIVTVPLHAIVVSVWGLVVGQDILILYLIGCLKGRKEIP